MRAVDVCQAQKMAGDLQEQAQLRVLLADSRVAIHGVADFCGARNPNSSYPRTSKYCWYMKRGQNKVRVRVTWS